MNAELVHQAAAQSREVFAQSCSTATDAIGYMEQVLLVALEKQSAAASTEAPPVQWGAPKTIGMLIRQLQTLPADMPAHGAFFTDLHGERRAFIRPLSMSCERVNSQFIERGNQAVPYSLVIWSAQDEREATAATPDALDAARYRWLRDGWGRTCNRVPHITQYPAQQFDKPRRPQIHDVGVDAAIDAAMQAGGTTGGASHD